MKPVTIDEIVVALRNHGVTNTASRIEKHGIAPLYQTGWVCPKCGGVYAPTIQNCFACSPPMEVT